MAFAVSPELFSNTDFFVCGIASLCCETERAPSLRVPNYLRLIL